MNACAASAEAECDLSPKAETDSRVYRVTPCRLVPDPSPRHDLADAAGYQRWPCRRRADLPCRRRDRARAAKARSSCARLRPVRDLPVASVGAEPPVADAYATRKAIDADRAARGRISARATNST